MTLHQLTIHELQKRLRSGEVTSADIVESVLARIDKVEDRIHSYVLVLKDSVREEARRADEELRRGAAKPLTGIPVAIKDLICTKGVTTACGSRILHNFVPPYDATVARKLFPFSSGAFARDNS